MLRRTRLVLPLLVGLAALAGAALPDHVPFVAGGAVLVAAGVTAWHGRVEAARLADVTGQVRTFATAEMRPPELVREGSREWQQLVAALEDVATELRGRFDALRGEQDRVQRLLDAMPTAVLLFGDDGLVYANPAAVELFTLGDLVGLTPVRALGVPSLAQAVVEAGAVEGTVSVSVTREGRELVGRATTTGPGEVALIVTDLSSVRRVEEMRRDFVANASHELKTPVTGMRALADSLHLAMDRDPDRARAMVGRIQSEATRLSQLVRDLLDLARLEEGVDGPAAQRIDLAELCAQQVERLQLVAEQHDVAVRLAGGDAAVVGIPDDVKLVVGNLIDNAIRYNQPGGTVEVAVRREGAAAVIQVVDDGIGIPESDQERIFERFYTVDKARSRAAGGTGLGLSLVRHAVERHGGRVSVTSVLGEGTTFTVVLPVDGGVRG